MNSFSISQLEQFSGIKAHTIRIWEQRYNALNPDRSEGNTRSYNGDQLRRLLNIASLLENGHKVSDLCNMSNSKLFALLDQYNQESTAHTDEKANYAISQLIAAGMTFDEVYFDKIFANCVLRFGLQKTYTDIIYPLLTRMGLMWSANTITPAYEHFISNLLKQKLFAAIDALPPATIALQRWVLFLPENEHHEIGLLFSLYLIRASGHRAVYLGADVPMETIAQAANEITPTHALFFFVHHLPTEKATQYLLDVKAALQKSKVYVGGTRNLLEKLPDAKNIHKIHSVEALSKQLTTKSV
jgi:MerR family transcriptional regulator, light-induced transcriptional regulator